MDIQGRSPTGKILTIATDEDGKLIISGDFTFGDVKVTDVEIANDAAHPVPTGISLKQVVGTVITRPADTTAYAIGDAISGSTSAPTLVQFDLAAAGISAGDSIQIRRCVFAFNAKPDVLPLITAYFSRTNFAHGVDSAVYTDNSPLAIPHAINAAGGAMLLCDVQSSSAINCRAAYVSPPVDMVLAPNDTKLYMIPQASNAFTPTSGMVITPIIWVVKL